MRDLSRKIDRILSLHRLAKNQRGNPEGDTALKQAKALEDRLGVRLPGDAFDDVAHQFETGYIWERIVLEILSDVFKVNYENLNDQVTIRGPKLVVDEIIEVFETHRDMAESLAITSSMGYLSAAIPEFADALIDQMEHQSSSQKTSSSPKENKGRYYDFNVFIRAFSEKTDQRFIDSVRKIGHQKRKPFWTKLFE